MLCASELPCAGSSVPSSDASSVVEYSDGKSEPSKRKAACSDDGVKYSLTLWSLHRVARLNGVRVEGKLR